MSAIARRATAGHRHPLGRLVARIMTGDGAPVGAAFAVGPQHLCTCAHVVQAALASKDPAERLDGRTIGFDFPFFPGAPPGVASVERAILGDRDVDDLALLKVPGLPEGVRPARMLPPTPLRGRPFSVYGFANPPGAWSYGVFDEETADATIQVRDPDVTGIPIQPGFSGAPVWDDSANGVAGMVVAAERERSTKTAYVIPSWVLANELDPVELAVSGDPLDPLTKGVVGSLAELQRFLAVHVGSADSPVPFGGRGDELDALEDWLASDATRGLVVARAGRGKSTMLARWALDLAASNRADVAFVPISLRFKTASKARVWEMLSERLATLRGPPAEPARDRRAWKRHIFEALSTPAAASDRPLVVIVDGADEAAKWEIGELPIPPTPAPWTKVLVSAREMAGRAARDWRAELEWDRSATLFGLPPLTVPGIVEILLTTGSPDLIERRVEIADELRRLTDGDPLEVGLYVRSLQESSDRPGAMTADELPALEPRLDGFFKHWWQDQRTLWKKQGKDPIEESGDTAALLNLSAAARGPLSRDEYAQIEGGRLASAAHLTDKLGELQRFLVEAESGQAGEKRYALTHPRFQEYLAAELMTADEAAGLDARLLRFCAANFEAVLGGHAPAQASAYALRHYREHMDAAGAAAADYYRLLEPRWFEAWLSADGTAAQFLEDLDHVWFKADDELARLAVEGTGAALAPHLAVQVRCLLMASSIGSAAGNAGSELLVQAVRTRRRSATWALAQLRGPDDDRAERVVAAIAPLLEGDEAAQQQALRVAQALSRERDQAAATASLAPFLDDDQLGQALAAAQRMEDALCAGHAIAALAPHLPDALIPPALAAAARLDDHEGRSLAVAATAPRAHSRVAGDVLAAVVDRLRGEADDVVARCLQLLAPAIGGDQAPAAVRLAADVRSRVDRARALAALVQHVDGVALTEARRAAEDVWRGARSDAATLAALAPVYGERAVEAALPAIDALDDDSAKATVLARLAPAAAPGQLEALFFTAGALADEEATTEALVALSPFFDEREADRAVKLARRDRDEQRRTRLLLAAAPRMPDTARREALAIAQRLESDADRAAVLEAITRDADDLLLLSIDAEAARLQNTTFRTNVLATVAARTEGGARLERVHALLASVDRIDDAPERSRLLAVLAQAGDGAGAELALETLESENSGDGKAWVRVALAVPAELAGRALDGAGRVAELTPWAAIARILVPKLPVERWGGVIDELERRLQSSRGTVDPGIAGILVNELLEAIVAAGPDDPSGRRAFEALVRDAAGSSSATALARVVPKASLQQRSRLAAQLEAEPQALDPRVVAALSAQGDVAIGERTLARAFGAAMEKYEDLDAAMALIPHLPDALREPALEAAVTRVVDETRSTGMPPSPFAFEPVLPLLTAEQLERLWLLADPQDPSRRPIGPPSIRQAHRSLVDSLAATFLIQLAPYVSAEQARRCLASVTRRLDADSSGRLAAALLPRVPRREVSAALGRLARLDDDEWSAMLAASSDPSVPQHVARELVARARAREPAAERTAGLLVLRHHLPPDERRTVVAGMLAGAREQPGPLHEQLGFAIAELPARDAAALLGEALHSLRPQRRSEVCSSLETLVPALAALAGPAGPAAAAAVVKSIGDWHA